MDLAKTATASPRHPKLEEYKKDFKMNWTLYLLILPVIAYYLVFCYKPMYGALIAFQNFSPAKGFLKSEWVGFQHFIDFFQDPYFFRILKNTLVISVSSLLFGFPAPIILAILINEISNNKFKRTVQTITYLPHFISLVVICGLIKDFVADKGIITSIYATFTGERINLLTKENLFVPIYVISEIWQGVGWGSIVYLAAMMGIDQELYEAAKIDGAGKWRQVINITIPSIVPTIVIMLILRMGSLLSVGFEKIILLYNATIYSTSDVISSYVYRIGLQDQNWSYSAAVGLFNSVINFVLLVTANQISKRVNDTSLW